MAIDTLNIEEIELNTVGKILDEYCMEFKRVYKDKLEKDGKRATGALIDNMETEIKVSGTTISVVLNVADYYYYVENGRKPGKFPPVLKIKKWIQDKPILPHPDKNGKLPTENQLAYLIGRKIATEGIKPGGQLKETVQTLNNIYLQKLQAALEADFNIYQIKILDEINKIVKI